jgi:hypothetical protein
VQVQIKLFSGQFLAFRVGVASIQFRHPSESLSNRLLQIAHVLLPPSGRWQQCNGGQALISIDKKPRLLGDKGLSPNKSSNVTFKVAKFR